MRKPGVLFPILGPAVLLAPFVAYQSLATSDELVRFFPDDAFYYLQSSYNLTRLGFPTFDGVHATNGFHPLNFLLTTALAFGLEKSQSARGYLRHTGSTVARFGGSRHPPTLP